MKPSFPNLQDSIKKIREESPDGIFIDSGSVTDGSMLLFSDSNGFVVRTTPINDYNRLDVINDIKDFLSGQKFPGNRQENYTNWLKPTELNVISWVYNRNNELVGMSTAAHRPSHFDPGSVRVLNRLFHLPDGWNYPRTTTVAMVMHQLLFARHWGYDHVFISREALNPNFAPWMRDILNGSISFGDWIAPDDLVLTAQAPDQGSCWQHTLYQNIQKNGKAWPMLSQTMTQNQYRESFRDNNL